MESDMESSQFLYLALIILISTGCITWLIFFATKMLTGHTDIGKEKKKEKKKSKNIKKK